MKFDTLPWHVNNLAFPIDVSATASLTKKKQKRGCMIDGTL